MSRCCIISISRLGTSKKAEYNIEASKSLNDIVTGRGAPAAPAAAPAPAPAAAPTSVSEAADDLMKLKELLDAGILPQAEFDAKKKQLLGL